MLDNEKKLIDVIFMDNTEELISAAELVNAYLKEYNSILIKYADYYREGTGYKTNADPARLAAQVVSGIGFLGAGAIIKEGVNVIGLTTAACIWVVSGVGLAVGAGYYIIAVFASLLVYIILEILSQMDSWLVPTDNIMIKIRMINDSEKIKEVYNALLKLGLKSKNFSVVFVSEDIVELNILMFNPHKLKLAEISTYFTSMEGVIKSIEIH